MSRSLIKSATGEKTQGWRIPALEIEHKLAAALSRILDDRVAIVHDLDRNLGAAKIKSALESVARWSARLTAEEERANALASLIERAEVSENGIRVSVRVPLEESSQSSDAASSFLHIRRQMPIELRRRGVEMRLVIGGDADLNVDSAILKMVARSNQWLLELLSGRSRSLAEIAERADLGKRYVNRIMRLAFLAPSIIEEIARGRQPPQLTAQALSTRRGDLPLSWQVQRDLLGFGLP